jgi:hypothetical protein
VPQLPAPMLLGHTKDQSTPRLLGSFVTTAVRFSEKLTASDPAGSGLKSMDTWDCGGGWGFCTLAVLPPPHPASNDVIAAAKSNGIHRLVVTADLLKLTS